MITPRSPRGTRDILPNDQPTWQTVRQQATATAEAMGYLPITLPTYEEATLFQRAIGEGTDIHDKELFLVRGIRADEETEQYALRPEATAGMVRAYLQNGMQVWPQPVRLFTLLNVFRYDRPQKGRYREHVQFDIEYFGSHGPFADAWVIYTTWRFLSNIGLEGLELRINTLGSSQERSLFLQELTAYLEPLRANLSEDSQHRLSTNPLRILDSKEASDRQICENAPKLADFLGTDSTDRFQKVLTYLSAWNISFLIDPFLVRGLDYYSHTTFEWTVQGKEGQQDSLGGGGRYDGLLTQLDGPDAGAVGAGIGLDRVVEELQRQGKGPTGGTSSPMVYLIAADEQGIQAIAHLADILLSQGISLELDLDRSGLGSQLKAAARSGAHWAILIGSQEQAQGKVTIRNLTDSTQQELPEAELVPFLNGTR